MEVKPFDQMTDEELQEEKKKLNKSKLFHAIFIGFLAGILIFGTVAWSLSDEKRIGFLIPMLFPVYFIRRTLKNSKANSALEQALKQRGLD